MSWIIAIALSASASMPSGRFDQQFLIFEFPDGARGGIGKIDGHAKPGVNLSEDTLALLKKCGLRHAKMYDQVTHRFYIYGLSAPSDTNTVRCLQRLTYKHFNVGRGRVVPQLSGMPQITDESMFRHFWRTMLRGMK